MAHQSSRSCTADHFRSNVGDAVVIAVVAVAAVSAVVAVVVFVII